jgi:putative glutamine amidotransferase
MSVRIAIPEPTGSDLAYNQRALSQYAAALAAAGADPVVVPLGLRQEEVARLIGGTEGILLPGSRFDIDPEMYGEERIPECAPSDPVRTAIDELLLQDAFNLHKPILGICGGAQAVNVWRNGTLIQDLKTRVNHRPGRDVEQAHRIRITAGSRLAKLFAGAPGDPWVNSSHHQAVRLVGDNLMVSAVSPEDEVIEAVELDSGDHFVVAVQWHPERTYRTSQFSREIFAGFVRAAQEFEPRRIEESVAGR